MGSTGSGSFSDYSNRPLKSEKDGSSSSGSSGDDICVQAFTTGIEDVEEYDYFSSNSTVPPVGAQLTVGIEGRIVAKDENGVIVGALPTKFNYIASCIKAGFNYSGVVTSSTTTPIPRVHADFAPVG